MCNIIKTAKILLIVSLLFAASTSISEEFVKEFLAVNYPQMLMGFFGGLAFLLYGLDKMSVSLKSLTGGNLKVILKKLTKTKLSSLITGMGMAATIQSSSAVAIMMISFVGVHVMKVPQALGVILGADVGTTVTVQLIAFRVNEYALIPLALGFFMQLALKKEKYIHIGHALMGVGMIFFGIKLIGDSMGLIKDIPIVIDTVSHISNPAIGVLVGCILTILMQSSAATLAVIIALSSQGVLPLETALILVLGANVGTCFTPLIASIGKNRQALHVALGHIGSKVIAVLLTIIFFSWVIEAISAISFTNTATNGMASMRDVANAHMLFNIMLAVSFLPFVSHISTLLNKLLPLRKEDIGIQPMYLDNNLLDTPSLALDAVKNELKRISKITNDILKDCLPAAISGEIEELNRIKQQERDIDTLYKACIKYLANMGRGRLSDTDANELSRLIALANDLESISDIAGEDIVTLGRKRARKGIIISKTTAKKLLNLHSKVVSGYEDALKAALTNSLAPAERTIKMKHTKMRPILTALRKHQSVRLLAKEKDRYSTHAIESDLIDKLKQAFYHSRKIARDVVDHIEQSKK